MHETQSKTERQWRRRGDFRVICDCQRHRRRGSSLWRSALRIASSSAAVLLGIPLAYAAFDVDSVANLEINVAEVASSLRATRKVPVSATTNALPMFTTRAVREQFLAPQPSPQRQLTIDVFKEAYFREHVPYGAIIFREARKNDLPPELVAAMVHTESDFRSTLVSHKSAQGLMQIVPSTARKLGIRDPFDPQQNIAGGARYYRYLLDRFDDQRVALAAYNAGEGNVERYGGIPPFPETRNYISRVSRHTARYRRRVETTYQAAMGDPKEAPQAR